MRWVTYVQKDFLKIQTLAKQLLTKYQIVTKLPQISRIHKNRKMERDRPLVSIL